MVLWCQTTVSFLVFYCLVTAFLYINVFVLSSIVITSLGEDGAGRFAGRLLVGPYFVVSLLFALTLGGGGGL